MLNPLGVLSLRLACQLLVPQNSTSVINMDFDTPLTRSAAEIPAGYTAFPDVGVAYKVYTDYPRTWNQARKHCEANGATLAIIDSFKKIEYLKTLGLNTIGHWVGFHRFFDNAEWINVKNGLLVTTLPWRHDSSIETTTRQCMAVIASTDPGLFTATCNYTKHTVCEVPLFKYQRLHLDECL